MHAPYTSQPLDACVIAQSSVALVLTAIACSRPSRPIASTGVLVVAVWWAALLPMEPQLLEAFGVTSGPHAYLWSLRAVETLATIAALLSGRPATIAFAVVAQVALSKISAYVVGSDWELAALHLAVLGAFVGLQARARDDDVSALGAGAQLSERHDERSFLAHDLRWLAIANLLAIVVSMGVLEQSIDSSDEWAYTFQAAVFAKAHAFAPAPPCTTAFRNFWVFNWMGRQFSQYTPGWPLFMAPFALLGIAQFAAATSLGLLVVGVARLARRAARESGHAPRAVAAAGTFAAACATLSSTLLVNGASRFPHVYAAALLAWGVEAACATVDACRSGKARSQIGWSVLFGACAASLWATRPGEGTVSAVGLGLYGLYALARGRVSSRALAGSVGAAAAVVGLTLVILRLQLGSWFKTGYSLTPSIYPWANWGFSWPKPGDWRYGIPIANGSYCWWPLSPAVGIAGLVTLRGRATRIAFMVGGAGVALFTFFAMSEFGRGWDWGYGPRFHLAVVVPMAVGTGVALGPLWWRARRHGLSAPRLAAAPLALAAVAVVFGALRLAPLVYPPNTASVHNLNGLSKEIRRSAIHHAVVLLPGGVGWPNDGLDLTTNLPVSLYPTQDVLIAMDKAPGSRQCLRENYPDRAFYTALPGAPPRLTPLGDN
jgi:hypothetical protein